MKYVINTRVGVVHTAGCSSLRRMSNDNLTEWDPTKAHLVVGATYDPECLSAVPAAPSVRCEHCGDTQYGAVGMMREALCDFLRAGGWLCTPTVDACLTCRILVEHEMKEGESDG